MQLLKLNGTKVLQNGASSLTKNLWLTPATESTLTKLLVELIIMKWPAASEVCHFKQ